VTTSYATNLTNLEALDVHARVAEVVTWCGRRALRLDGLALVPDLEVREASIEVEIWAEGACYPGIVFRVADVLNFELAYAVPHCSAQWDALQYDPVFHGSNTWQLYHGEAYQKAATVPMGEWFHLRMDVQGTRAAVSVEDRPPLVLRQLAHPHAQGRVGIWTYLPAYFSNLRVSPCRQMPEAGLDALRPPPGTFTEWFVDGFGRVQCEPSGVLNLNRCLPASLGELRLTRCFETLSAQEIELAFGFSDELSLEVDGQVLFTGTNAFKGFGSYDERGYVDLDAHSARLRLEPGVHQLAAAPLVGELCWRCVGSRCNFCRPKG